MKFSQAVVIGGGRTDTTWMVFESDLLELEGKKFVQLTPSIRALIRLVCGDGDKKAIMESALNLLKTKRTEATIKATMPEDEQKDHNVFGKQGDPAGARGWVWANTQKRKKVKTMAELGMQPATIELQLDPIAGFTHGHTMVVCAGADRRNNMFIELVTKNFDYIAQMCQDLIIAEHEDNIEWIDKILSWRATHLKDVLLCQVCTQVVLRLRCCSTCFDVFACLDRGHSCSLTFVYLDISRSVANRGLFCLQQDGEIMHKDFQSASTSEEHKAAALAKAEAWKP